MVRELGTAFSSIKSHFQSCVHVIVLSYGIATSHRESQEDLDLVSDLALSLH